jgi:Domain of unknown function (DUF4336)
MAGELDTTLHEYVPERIWIKKYPLRFAGCSLFARTTFVRLSSGELLVHSPGPVDDGLVTQLRALGPLRHIVAPGNFHHLYVSAWQRAFPDATTWICPGLERKRPELEFDWFLADRAPEPWAAELDQVLVRGSRVMWEVAFFDRRSKTLILTDLIENIGDTTEATNWVLRFWWKVVLHMWGRQKPAPEYQFGWQHKAAARRSLERILAWDFERVVIAHGENLDSDAKRTVRRAWARPLSFTG